MNLQEATIKSLMGQLNEEKYLVNRRNWEIHNEHEADWFGGSACWEDIRELKLKTLSDEEKVKALQSLKDNIDEDVVKRSDYNDIDKKYVAIWLNGYKTIIDELLQEINTKGKYYISLNVDAEDRGDVDHRSFDLICQNGNIQGGIKYYDNKQEADRDLNTISKEDIKKFIKDNVSKEIIQWDVSVKEYEPSTWELR